MHLRWSLCSSVLSSLFPAEVEGDAQQEDDDKRDRGRGLLDECGGHERRQDDDGRGHRESEDPEIRAVLGSDPR